MLGRKLQRVGNCNIHLFYHGQWKVMISYVGQPNHRTLIHKYDGYADALDRYNDIVEAHSVLVAKQALGLES